MNGKTQNKYTSVKIHNCQARMTEKIVSQYSLAYEIVGWFQTFAHPSLIFNKKTHP